jgi:hypothetical protein
MKKVYGEEQMMKAALSLLCDVSPEYIRENFGMTYGTARQEIPGLYKSYPLIRLFKHGKRTERHQRLRNSALIRLAYGGRKVEHGELVDMEACREVCEAVENDIYRPRTEKAARDIRLDSFLTPFKGFHYLLEDIFGKRSALDVLEPLLLDRLYEEYHAERFSIEGVYEDVKDTTVKKIIQGGLDITPRKESLILDVLMTLDERERDVILKLYEMGKTLEKAGEDYKPPARITFREDIRIIKEKALRRLRDPSRSLRLRILTGLATDPDVDYYISGFYSVLEEIRHYSGMYPGLATESETERYTSELNKDLQRLNWYGTLNSGINGRLLTAASTDSLQPFRDDLGIISSIMNAPTGSLDVGERACKLFRIQKIGTVRELLQKRERDLLMQDNFSRESLNSVRQALARLGLRMKR